MSGARAPELPRLVVRMMSRRARADAAHDAVAQAREALEQLAAVMVPLISEAGFDALVDRALHLTQREYPGRQEPDLAAGAPGPDRLGRWLEELNERHTLEAAAALLSALASLLTTLIGESLTTRYLRKAWPDAFKAAAGKGTT